MALVYFYKVLKILIHFVKEYFGFSTGYEGI